MGEIAASAYPEVRSSWVPMSEESASMSEAKYGIWNEMKYPQIRVRVMNRVSMTGGATGANDRNSKDFGVPQIDMFQRRVAPPRPEICPCFPLSIPLRLMCL